MNEENKKNDQGQDDKPKDKNSEDSQKESLTEDKQESTLSSSDELNQKEKNSATQKAVTIIKEKSLMINGLLLVVAIAFGYLWYSANASKQVSEDIGIEKAERKLLSFVEENMVQLGTKVSVKGMSVEKGLYRADLEIQGQSAITYISKDGTTFYPQGYDIDEIAQSKTEAEQAENVEVPKSEKPKVEAFVMSYCPYGTQIQKGLLPVVETLGEAIDFDFKFVDYAMHGEKEIEENVRQYCIAENEPNKFEKYLDCFLESGESADCLKDQSINTTLLTKCANKVDADFSIDEKVQNKDEWESRYPPFDLHKEENEKYSVQGSPTLVINGVTAQSKRDPASLLETICSAFENKPSQCDETLSDSAPAPGFGSGEAASSTEGTCN